MRTVGWLLVSLALGACQPAGSNRETRPDPATPAASPAAEASVEYFYFGNHVPRAVITAVEGIDTASARLVGHVTAADNHAYCLDMTGGPDSSEAVAQCEAENKDQPDETMSADCIARTVSDGGPAAWVGNNELDGGKVMPVWQDVESGETRSYTGAGGADRLTDAFRMLCPKASANIADGWPS